jgi:hypothetical protein
MMAKREVKAVSAEEAWLASLDARIAAEKRGAKKAEDKQAAAAVRVERAPVITMARPHPATLAVDVLLRDCVMGKSKSGGPGGQNRNKVETTVTLTHMPSGVETHAGERRTSMENKRMALMRLRLALAVQEHPNHQAALRYWAEVQAEIGRRIALAAQIESLEVQLAPPPARVIVNARTGTVVIGGEVRILPSAVAHGNLTVRVTENQQASQPNAFGRGETAITQQSSVEASEARGRMQLFQPGARLGDIVDAVNALGAAPGDLVAILEALKAAGALRAELMVI